MALHIEPLIIGMHHQRIMVYGNNIHKFKEKYENVFFFKYDIINLAQSWKTHTQLPL